MVDTFHALQFALDKHIDVTKAVGDTDPRASMQVQKCIQSYLLCCQLGNLYGSVNSNQMGKGVLAAYQSATAIAAALARLESRMGLHMQRQQSSIAP